MNMRLIRILKVTEGIFLLCGLAVFAACYEDPNPDAEAQLRQALTYPTWRMLNVYRDDVNVNSEYENFTLKFMRTSYNTTHGGTSWPAMGTWKFVENSANTVAREDGIEVTFDLTNSNKQLNLVFTIPENRHGGRSKSLRGNYRFELVWQ